MRRGLTMDSPTLANLDKLLRWAARNWCLLVWSGRVEREETCCQIQSHLRSMRIEDHCCENILGVCSLSGLGCLWSFSCWYLLSFAYMRNTVLFSYLACSTLVQDYPRLRSEIKVHVSIITITSGSALSVATANPSHSVRTKQNHLWVPPGSSHSSSSHSLRRAV